MNRFRCGRCEKTFQLMSKSGMRAECWTHVDDFIENGKLMTTKKVFRMEEGKLALISDYRDSFSIDKHRQV